MYTFPWLQYQKRHCGPMQRETLGHIWNIFVTLPSCRCHILNGGSKAFSYCRWGDCQGISLCKPVTKSRAPWCLSRSEHTLKCQLSSKKLSVRPQSPARGPFSQNSLNPALCLENPACWLESCAAHFSSKQAARLSPYCQLWTSRVSKAVLAC